MPEKKYSYLLDNVHIKRWYDNLSRGSFVTADTSLRRLGVFCKKANKPPLELIDMSEQVLSDLLMDFVTQMEKEGYAGSYVSQYVKSIKSWLIFNHKHLNARIKIKGMGDTPSLRNERTPTQDELRAILLSANKKARVASILIAHAGLREEVLGNYKGLDGIRIGDFPELIISKEKTEFNKIPTLVVIRRELSKAGHQYLTFLSMEGCGYLKDYLEERRRNGESLTKDSPIITPKTAQKKFIRTVNIGDAIREAIRAAGFQWRPYVLRHYFATQFMLAESKGQLLHDYRVFWMGHKGDIENRYTTNKCILSELVIEDMREAYSRCQPFLQTTKMEEPSEEKLRQSFRKQLMLVAGFSQTEVEGSKISSVSDEQLQEMIRERLLGANSNHNKQKVVNVTELEQYLAQEWDFISNLPDNKVLIRRNK